jgi:hypothetical protein
MEDDDELFTESNIANFLLSMEMSGMIEVVGYTEEGEEVYKMTADGYKESMQTFLSFDQWLEIGYRNNFCSPPVCYTHDGVPMTATEMEQLDNGDEPCMHLLRLYEDTATRKGVEAFHTPTVLRASELGWDK